MATSPKNQTEKQPRRRKGTHHTTQVVAPAPAPEALPGKKAEEQPSASSFPATSWEQEPFLNQCGLTLEEIQRAGIIWEELAAIFEDHRNRMEGLQYAASSVSALLQRHHAVHSVRVRVKEPSSLIRKIIRKRLDEKPKNIRRTYKGETSMREANETPAQEVGGDGGVGGDGRRVALELAIVDPDIAASFAGINPDCFVSGSAARLQIARSLKRVVALLEKSQYGHNGHNNGGDCQDYVEPEDLLG